MRFLASSHFSASVMVKSRNSGVEPCFFQVLCVTPQAVLTMT